jgi:hypothetical protein
MTFDLLKTKLFSFIQGLSPYRAVNPLHLGYTKPAPALTFRFLQGTQIVFVLSESPKKPTQFGYLVEILMLKLVLRKVTDKLEKVNHNKQLTSRT